MVGFLKRENLQRNSQRSSNVLQKFLKNKKCSTYSFLKNLKFLKLLKNLSRMFFKVVVKFVKCTPIALKKTSKKSKGPQKSASEEFIKNFIPGVLETTFIFNKKSTT